MKFRRSGSRNPKYNQCQLHKNTATGMPGDDCPMCLQEVLEKVLLGQRDFDEVLEPRKLIHILHRLLLETNINTQYIEHMRYQEEHPKCT